jgi:hypothetical protein
MQNGSLLLRLRTVQTQSQQLGEHALAREPALRHEKPEAAQTASGILRTKKDTDGTTRENNAINEPGSELNAATATVPEMRLS